MRELCEKFVPLRLFIVDGLAQENLVRGLADFQSGITKSSGELNQLDGKPVFNANFVI